MFVQNLDISKTASEIMRLWAELETVQVQPGQLCMHKLTIWCHLQEILVEKYEEMDKFLEVHIQLGLPREHELFDIYDHMYEEVARWDDALFH